MKINLKDFRVRPGTKVKLNQWPTTVKPFCKSKKRYEKLLEAHVEQLSALQQLHYASHRYALLLIFQGMDASGKDGAIRHVMSGVNPQGCEVFSFKQPTADELEHDFLWRTNRHLPERGRIGIFNRSYYEEVLVVRVHPEILRSQGLPEELRDEKSIWQERYRSITDLEQHLHRNGTRTFSICTAPVTPSNWSCGKARWTHDKATDINHGHCCHPIWGSHVAGATAGTGAGHPRLPAVRLDPQRSTGAGSGLRVGHAVRRTGTAGRAAATRRRFL